MMAGDFDQAAGLIDGNTFAPLRVSSVRVRMRLRRGVDARFLESAKAPRRVRPGQRIRVRLIMRAYRGPKSTVTIPVRVPRTLRPGNRKLVLRATSGDGAGMEDLVRMFADIFGGEEGGGGADRGPASLPELTMRVGAIARFDGVEAMWKGGARGRHGEPPRPVYRAGEQRLSGRVEVRVRVVKQRRAHGGGHDKARAQRPGRRAT
jgi:hypothetical protein